MVKIDFIAKFCLMVSCETMINWGNICLNSGDEPFGSIMRFNTWGGKGGGAKLPTHQLLLNITQMTGAFSMIHSDYSYFYRQSENSYEHFIYAAAAATAAATSYIIHMKNVETILRFANKNSQFVDK